MAQRPEIVQPGDKPKQKRKRSPSVAKPAFFVIQILNEQGEPVPFDKRLVKLVTVERNAETVMEMMDNPTHPHAFYLRGIVPVTRAAVRQNTGSTPAAA